MLEMRFHLRLRLAYFLVQCSSLALALRRIGILDLGRTSEPVSALDQ